MQYNQGVYKFFMLQQVCKMLLDQIESVCVCVKVF